MPADQIGSIDENHLGSSGLINGDNPTSDKSTFHPSHQFSNTSATEALSSTKHSLTSTPCAAGTEGESDMKEQALQYSISFEATTADKGSKKPSAKSETDEDSETSTVYYDAHQSIRTLSSTGTPSVGTIKSLSTIDSEMVGTYLDQNPSEPSTSESDSDEEELTNDIMPHVSANNGLARKSNPVRKVPLSKFNIQNRVEAEFDTITKFPAQKDASETTPLLLQHAQAPNLENPMQVQDLIDMPNSRRHRATLCEVIKAYVFKRHRSNIIVHLIRHGQAYHNLNHERGVNVESFNIIDPCLTPKGVNQALALRAQVREEHQHPAPTLILTSPLTRALETTLLVFQPSPEADNTAPQIVAFDDLRECGSYLCNYRKTVTDLERDFGSKGVDMGTLPEIPPPLNTNNVSEARAEVVRNELLEIGEILRHGGGEWKGVQLRGKSTGLFGKSEDIHIMLVGHGSFFQKLLHRDPNRSGRSAFMPTELRTYVLSDSGTLIETRPSLVSRLSRMWKEQRKFCRR